MGSPARRRSCSASNRAMSCALMGSVSWAINQTRGTCKICSHSIWNSSRGSALAAAMDRSVGCLVMPQRCQQLGLMLGQQGVRQLVQIALHDVCQFVQRKVDAVIRYPALRIVVGADALGAVTGANQAFTLRGFLGVLLLLLLV